MIGDLKPYPAYKDSGVPWLGKVPEHWKVIPNRAILREVKERDCPEEPLLSVTISEGIIPQLDLLADTSKKDSSNVDKSAYKLVRLGDIAYNKMRAWQGAIGASAYQGIISPAYVVQRPSEGVIPYYLHSLMRIPAFTKEAERWSYGITSDMWSLRPEHFKLIYSCCPPFEEQTLIIRFLNCLERCADDFVHAKQKLVKLFREKKQAIIHHTVKRSFDPDVRLRPSGISWLEDVPQHWGVRRLRAVCKIRISNVDKHKRENELPVRLCNYVDVYKNEIIKRGLAFMSATATKDEIERVRLRSGDVLITKDSETWNDIGVSALVEEPENNLVSGYHLALLRPLPEHLHGPYLFRVFQTPAISHQLHVAASGVTRYGLSNNSIKSVWLSVPPLSEQIKITSFLDKKTAQIDTAIKLTQRQILLLREFHTRLISDVVTGKLDVREAAAQLPKELSELGSGDATHAPPHLPTGIDRNSETSAKECEP